MSEPSSSGSEEKQSQGACGSHTETIQAEEEEQQTPILQLRLNQPKNEHKVKWSSDTIDNEFMGKKKSKCCCIYEKQKVFGESSTSEEEEGDGCTPHCKGHKKKCFRKTPHHHHNGHHDHDDEGHSSGSQNGTQDPTHEQ